MTKKDDALIKSIAKLKSRAAYLEADARARLGDAEVDRILAELEARRQIEETVQTFADAMGLEFMDALQILVASYAVTAHK